MKHLKEKTDLANLRGNLLGLQGWQWRWKLINQIATAELRMLEPGCWRVIQYVYGIREDYRIFDFLSKGPTPEQAVENHWVNLTEPDFFFAVNSVDYYRWNSDNFEWDRYVRSNDKTKFELTPKTWERR